MVFVDEIDRSMHPTLTAEFVSLFYKSTKNENVQLIATTHESSLLDLGKVRRDEIWFVERLNKGSKLFSLDDFKVRYDKQIEKDYLLGRYGAIPLLVLSIPSKRVMISMISNRLKGSVFTRNSKP